MTHYDPRNPTDIPWPRVIAITIRYVGLGVTIVGAMFAGSQWLVEQIVKFEMTQQRTTTAITEMGAKITDGLKAQDEARTRAIDLLNQAVTPRITTLEHGLDQTQSDLDKLTGVVMEIEDYVKAIDGRTDKIDKRTAGHDKVLSDTDSNIKGIQKTLRNGVPTQPPIWNGGSKEDLNGN